jgi:hypothetical protein
VLLMRRLLLLIFLTIIPDLLSAQVIFRKEGIVVNNSITGNWEGVNIPRSVQTTFYFLNNSVTSVNSAGYLLQAGDEGPLSTNNNLDGALIAGNKFTWNGTDPSSITHGVFTGYNVNYTIRYNYLDRTPYGILFKSGNDNGTNLTYNSAYGASYNIIKNALLSLRMKGINGIRVYNNTFYCSFKSGSVILIDANHDRAIPAPATGAKIKNNIFYTVNQMYNISIESGCLKDFESDYNIFYCESGTPVFAINGVKKTFAQWQALGYDLHSVVINPDFINTTGFVPKKRLDYGTNLGTGWETGLSTTATWITGTAPATTIQNGKWQAGAIIYPQPAVTQPPPVTTPPVTTQPPVVTVPPVTTAPAPVNLPPVVLISSPPQNLSGFIGELDATVSYDPNNDKLSYTWITPPDVSVSSTNSSKIKFLSPVVNAPMEVEFTLKISDGKITETKSVPVEILPYRPELDSAEIIKIEASSFFPPNYPNNILDGNTGTMWAADGDEQWLMMELKDFFIVQHIKVAFQEDQNNVSYFDVLGSEDKESWEPLLTKSASCGFSGDIHVFDFPASKASLEFKYIKLIGHSNSADTWNKISEFKIFGYKHQSYKFYEQQSVKLYPNPAHESINIRIDDSTLNPDFIRIINLTGKVLLENRLDSGINDFQIPINFKEGIYIVQIGSGDITLFTQKLIVKV